MAINITTKTVNNQAAGTEIVNRDSAEVIADEKRSKAAAVPPTSTPETPATQDINVTIDVTALAEQQKASMDQIIELQKQLLERVVTWPGQASFPSDLEGEQGGVERSSVYIAPLSTRRAGLSAGDAIKEYNHIFEHTQKASFDGGPGMGTIESIDHRSIDRFVRENRQALQAGMQD
jgi:hypothetical protein